MSKKKAVRIIACATAAALVLGASLAYFTDRATTSETGTAGTVGVDMTSNIDLSDADGKNILNPGDLRNAGFDVENTGNKSIDVRETIKLTSSVPMTKDGQAEFEIYAREDVEEVEGKGYQPKAGKNPITVRSISEDGKTITYAIPEYVLNGNERFGDNNREIEDGITADNRNHDYVFVFKQGSSNAFQDADVKVEVLAEAKQHRNLAGWETVATETYTFKNGDTASTVAALQSAEYTDANGKKQVASSIQDAITNSADGKIKLTKDTESNGFITRADQNVEIDLNGKTLTVLNAVGSAGTETNGMQLLKGSNVTLKNGTITTDNPNVYILIQNYSDLTLDNVVIDARNTNADYALSNNFGHVTVKGNTEIYAKDGGTAFDLWYGLHSSYDDGVSVTFGNDFTGKVVGNIEYGAARRITNSDNETWKTKTILSIDAPQGTFDSTLVQSSTNALPSTGIQISNYAGTIAGI